MLVLETSFYTKNKPLKAFKSLEAFSQMVSGYTTSVSNRRSGKYVVRASVRHSPRVNDDPLVNSLNTDMHHLRFCQPIAIDVKLDWMARISRVFYFIWRQLHEFMKSSLIRKMLMDICRHMPIKCCTVCEV